MADLPSSLGNITPEAAALQLLAMIGDVEKKHFLAISPAGRTAADRAWILDTYAECLEAARGGRALLGQG